MPWTPTFAATDVRAIVGNLSGFFETNQAAALSWASPSRPLSNLTLYDSAEVRIQTDFPHMGLVRRRMITGDADDGLRIRYELTLEFEIAAEHTKAGRKAALTQLRKDTDNYLYAFESMILNCPDATLLAGVNGATRCYKAVTASDPLEVAVSDTKSLFNVQTQVVIETVESTFN